MQQVGVRARTANTIQRRIPISRARPRRAIAMLQILRPAAAVLRVIRAGRAERGALHFVPTRVLSHGNSSKTSVLAMRSCAKSGQLALRARRNPPAIVAALAGPVAPPAAAAAVEAPAAAAPAAPSPELASATAAEAAVSVCAAQALEMRRHEKLHAGLAYTYAKRDPGTIPTPLHRGKPTAHLRDGGCSSDCGRAGPDCGSCSGCCQGSCCGCCSARGCGSDFGCYTVRPAHDSGCGCAGGHTSARLAWGLQTSAATLAPPVAH